MFTFDKGRLLVGQEWIDLGQVTAMKIELRNGMLLYSGEPEAVLRLMLTDEDKQVLTDLKIKS